MTESEEEQGMSKKLLSPKAGYDQHTSPQPQHTISQEGYIPQFIQYLEKKNKAEPTIRVKFKVLRVMIRESIDLLDPEAVKLFIKKYKNWSDGHKMVAAYAYNDFCKMRNIQWEVSKYRWKETIPSVPTEKEIDALIAGTSK